MKLMRIGICIPSKNVWEPDFGLSLAMSMATLVNFMPDDIQVDLKPYIDINSILPKQRTKIVQRALDDGMTHLILLDDDMSFPLETLPQLLMHDKDIVAANYVTKQLPPVPVARDFDKKPVYTFEESTGLEKVGATGAGIMVIKTDVFRDIPQPWFAMPWCDKIQDIIGEDTFFLRKAKECGYDCYIDHDVSKTIKHIGRFSYGHEHRRGYFTSDKKTRQEAKVI